MNKLTAWTTHETKELLHTCVFDVISKTCENAEGHKGDYFVMNAQDWVMTLPVIDNNFLLVRQWRHGLEKITTEFPGGLVDPGEEAIAAGARELREETGFRAGKMTHLGSVNPNPALFTNRVHFYLAEDLVREGAQALDEDENVDVIRLPIREVLTSYGEGEFLHALTGTALSLYLSFCLKNGRTF